MIVSFSFWVVYLNSNSLFGRTVIQEEEFELRNFLSNFNKKYHYSFIIISDLATTKKET